MKRWRGDLITAMVIKCKHHYVCCVAVSESSKSEFTILQCIHVAYHISDIPESDFLI